MAQGGVQVTAKRRFGQFLITKPPTVEIDGVAVGQARWSAAVPFPVAAGPHRLTVSFPYMGKKRAGEASLDVVVPADQTIALLYRSPWVVTAGGSLQITG